jgi:hypothetical protein
MTRHALCLLLCLWGAVAGADLLPSGAMELSERFGKNPGTFDRTDPWCEGQGVGESCQIPGNAFEGGGPGRCVRRIDRGESKYIDLHCEHAPKPRIERAMPAGPWQADAGLCRLAAEKNYYAEVLRERGWVCVEPPVLADRFCKGREAGQACVAELMLDERSERFDGICKRQTDVTSVYFQGGQRLTRPMVTCEPERPLAPGLLKPVSAWRKLLQ